MKNIYSLYDHLASMRHAAISDQIDRVDKHVEDLCLDMQSAIHNEFVYLKMLLVKKEREDSSAMSIDYGGPS
jgi:hypothetical protein